MPRLMLDEEVALRLQFISSKDQEMENKPTFFQNVDKATNLDAVGLVKCVYWSDIK
jgi:hypothetical protein